MYIISKVRYKSSYRKSKICEYSLPDNRPVNVRDTILILLDLDMSFNDKTISCGVRKLKEDNND